MNGTIESITPDWRGGTLASAVVLLDDVLEVDDTADFDEESGGWLTIADDDPVAYTTVDHDAATVTLATPSATVYEAGDPVIIWDPSVPPAGAKVVEYVASVMSDRGAVDAVVPHEKIPLAGVDNLIGASVTLDEDSSGWYVSQVLGREPIIDGSTIDTSTLPPMPGGQTISDDAPVEVAGYPEDYGWWQVDADGKVLGFWRLTGGVWTPATVVTQDALNANNVLTNALTGKTITGTTIQTRATADRGIKLGQVQGSTNYDEAFIVFNESGVPFIKAVPAEELAVIAGEVKATTSTVIEGASLGGVTEITRGPVNADNPTGSPGALRLTAYTTAPKSAPTVTTGYDTVQFTDDGMWGNRRGWATDGTYWYTSRQGGTVEKWDASGARVLAPSYIAAPAGGVVYAGGKIYNLFDFSAFSSSLTWIVNQYDPVTLTSEKIAKWNDADGSAAPSLGVDPATGELLIAQSRASDGKVVVRRYTMPATSVQPLVASATSPVTTDFAYANDLAGVTYGTHDLGANRYVFTSDDSGRFQVTNSSGAAVDAERWQSGMGAKVGFTYTGGAFVSMDTNGVMRTYTGQDKAVVIGSGDLTKWISNTLANATYETDQSPRAKVTINKRVKVNVSPSRVNSGGTNAPDRVKIYVGKGTTDPGRTAMWKQTDPPLPDTSGQTTGVYSSIATSGTNPPASNNFPVGHVQRLELADGTVVVDGLGDGSAWATWTPTWTGATTNPAIGNGTIVGRYRRLGKNVDFYIEITAGSTTTFGTGLWSLDLPITEVARRWTMTGHAYDTSANNEYPIVAIRTASDTINIRCDPTTAGGQLRGVATGTPFTWATGDILHVSGTYEAA